MTDMRRWFTRTEDGVHLINTTAQGEHTLCGDAFDRDDSEDAPGAKWQDTTSMTVTCPRCTAVIRLCRGVRTLIPSLPPIPND